MKLERRGTPAANAMEILRAVLVLFVRRLVGLMLIAAAFPPGSRVNNEADVGGPPATPHIPPASPLREKTLAHPGPNWRS